MQTRRVDQAWISIAIGTFIFLFGLIILEVSILIDVFFILFFSAPFVFYGLYVLKHPLKSSAPSIQDIQERRVARKEEEMISVDAEFLYWGIWREYVRTIGAAGPAILERRLHDYMDQGLSKEEAIKKLAKIEKIY
jgi:hypothetical protein